MPAQASSTGGSGPEPQSPSSPTWSILLRVRREPLHPQAQQTFANVEGFRFTGFLTDRPVADIATVDARHRAHARVDDHIRYAKTTGLATVRVDAFDRSWLWCQLMVIPCDLLTVAQRLALRGTYCAAEPQVSRSMAPPTRTSRRHRRGH